MNLLICLETGLREIAAHKFRSALSMLGIVLGVSSLIATMALTNGIEQGTRAFMQQVGGLEYVSVSNKDLSNEMFDFWNLSPGRTLMDAKAIRASAPLISHISPEMAHQVLVEAGSNSMRLQARGVWPDHFVVGRHELAAGRFITPLDVEMTTKSAVLGDDVARRLFPRLKPQEMIGRTVTLNQSPFVVVGVFMRYERDQDKRMRALLEAQGKKVTAIRNIMMRRDPFQRKNESVLIPLSTMFYEYKSGLFPEDSMESVRLETLSLRVGNLDLFRETLDQVRGVLMTTHRQVEDFDLETREEWFDRMDASISATRLSGGLLAAISLLVGGIGITNIMLASITERVREIGIRLAVGARGRDIFLQIVVESVSIASIGGLIGVAAGAGLIQLLLVIAPTENLPVMTWDSIILSVSFAVLAGIFSGIYPAMRASRLDPISALRYE